MKALQAARANHGIKLTRNQRSKRSAGRSCLLQTYSSFMLKKQTDPEISHAGLLGLPTTTEALWYIWACVLIATLA
jgi:hypothetical protein